MQTRIFTYSLIALSLSVLAGCKAIDAMDNTETMKTDLAAMKNVTGGMATTTEEMKNTTNELKRKASLGEGLKLIEAPENQKEFAPPSKGLLAGAKLVAENMNSEELVKFFQAGLKEIRKTAPNAELEGDRTVLGGFPARYVAEFNRKKEVQVVTLQAIAALVPQKMIEQIIQEQLQGPGGAQSDETKDMLMLRAMFINNFFLSESMFATGKKLDNLGKLRNAMDYTRQLKFLAEVSKDHEITFVVEDAFLPPVMPSEKLPTDPECVANPADAACHPSLGQARVFAEKLDAEIAKPWFRKIAKRIDKEIPDNLRGGSSPYAREIAEIKEECLRN